MGIFTSVKRVQEMLSVMFLGVAICTQLSQLDSTKTLETKGTLAQFYIVSGTKDCSA